MGRNLRDQQVRLYSTTGNMAAFNGDDDAEVIWQDVAGLTIRGYENSQVHHVITGTIRGRFDDNEGTEAIADFLFRIIDENDRIVCSRRIQWIEDNPDETLSVFFPFSFQCFDTLLTSGTGTYRLQADLLDERKALENNQVFLEYVDWSATVIPD